MNENRGKFINFAEIVGEFINFVEIGRYSKCIIGLREMYGGKSVKALVRHLCCAIGF